MARAMLALAVAVETPMLEALIIIYIYYNRIYYILD